jgi:hypothetical protein
VHKLLRVIQRQPLLNLVLYGVVATTLVVTSTLYFISFGTQQLQKIIVDNLSISTLLQLSNIGLTTTALSRLAVHTVNTKAQDVKLSRLELSAKNAALEVTNLRVKQSEDTADVRTWVNHRYKNHEERLMKLETIVELLTKYEFKTKSDE